MATTGTAGLASSEIGVQVMETPCDDPDKLWGMSGGGAAVLFLFLGILIGAGLGVGVMLLRQRRQRKQVSKRPEGGWRISTALSTGRPTIIGQDAPNRLAGCRDSVEDDSTFANILKQAMLVLGKRPTASPAKPPPPSSRAADESNGRELCVRVDICKDGEEAPKLVQDGSFDSARFHTKPSGVRDDSFEDVVLQDASAIQDSMESGSVGSLAFPLEKLQASIGGPRNGLQKVPEDEREAQSPTTPLGDPKAPQTGSDELCSSIDSHYDLDDLDDDWLMLLQQIDERLIDSGKATMIPRERSVAIRSLLATADNEDRDAALDRAIADVEQSRS